MFGICLFGRPPRKQNSHFLLLPKLIRFRVAGLLRAPLRSGCPEAKLPGCVFDPSASRATRPFASLSQVAAQINIKTILKKYLSNKSAL
jgi:hypothetical protein